MSNKKIIIPYHDEFFIIPHPKDLLKNIGTHEVHQIIYRNGKPVISILEIKQFFIYNSNIFQLYLEDIVNKNILPSNFYMFIDDILYLIKIKNLKLHVDNYWQNLLNN
jgi:hypothetical protein